MSFKLLTRDQFREYVFRRDGRKCVVCGAAACPLDAHHIVERKLWSDGGYYLENGATLCETHHREAEATTLSCVRLRELCGIKSYPLPAHLEDPIDKWGNPILPNGMRLRGELHDAIEPHLPISVRAVFTRHVKYPRTYHLPWSPGLGDGDRVVDDLSTLRNVPVVVTAKMDGENTTLYRDGLHARSVNYTAHPSRDWLRATHARIANDIPDGWRVCGENLYAQHSIKYKHLASYFQVFSIWNDKNMCFSWADTCEYAALLGLETVPVIYRGAWDERLIREAYTPSLKGDPCEGYVVRPEGSFAMRHFRECVVKYVRAGHIQTSEHWLSTPVERNGLETKRWL